MLSSVSKLADKAFVLGYFLPSLLGLFLWRRIYGCPDWLGDVCKIGADNPFANLTYAALTVWVFAVLLLAGNHWCIRWLEGYEGPFKWFPFFKGIEEARHRKLWGKYEAAKGDDYLRGRLRAQFLRWFPLLYENVLPSGFGNAIRAFEMYPVEVYGIDAIVGYDRLGSVVSKEVRTSISDAKSLVDFFVNLTLLSAAITAGSLMRLAWESWHDNWKLPADYRTCVTCTIAFAIIGVLVYSMATLSVPAWGDQVKSAFDCYLPDLAKQMGYKLPGTTAERRLFWRNVSELTAFRYLPIPPDDFAYLSSSDAHLKDKSSEGSSLSVGEDGKAQESEPDSEGEAKLVEHSAGQAENS